MSELSLLSPMLKINSLTSWLPTLSSNSCKVCYHFLTDFSRPLVFMSQPALLLTELELGCCL